MEEKVMVQSPNSVNKSMEGCVMLALSTFRKSDKAVDTAIEKAHDNKKLMVVYAADINLARYLVEPEASLLEKHEKEGRKHVAAIAEKAKGEGIEVKTHCEVSRFGLVCLDLVQQEKPSLIITTRSKRPEWMRKLFGSPVDELVAKAGCPVIVI
jgi:nucleotide-binding universal stress UspA family protein